MTYFQPLLPALLAAGAAGLYLLNRRSHRAGRLLAALSILGTFLVCWPPVAWLLVQPLERSFPASLYPDGEAGAIVVLEDGMEDSSPALPEVILGHETYQRCSRAAWLYRNWRQLPVIASGGSLPDRSCAAMRRALAGMSVPAEAVWTECRSTSTHENARFTAEILRQKGIRRIALVTSAFHMLRAVRCFEKEGFQVAPAASGYVNLRDNPHKFIPGWAPLARNENTLHEVVGLLVYRLRGRI